MGLQQQVRGTDVVLAAVFEEWNLESGWESGGGVKERTVSLMMMLDVKQWLLLK